MIATLLAMRVSVVDPAWRDAIHAELLSATDSVSHSGVSDLALAIELIYEGWLLHQNRSRIIGDEVSADLALLIGDWCYAAGLVDVARFGTLDDVTRLARLVAEVSAEADLPYEQRDEKWNLVRNLTVEQS